MAYEVKILADSIASRVRLTTHLVTFPRFILAEVNTHRVFSRNSASSRAIPVEKRIEQILADPFIPEAFGANKKGMQAGEALSLTDEYQAQLAWINARDQAVLYTKLLAKCGVHKQWANRVLEPFAWHTAIITATEWDNFFALRCNPEASPPASTTPSRRASSRRSCETPECAPGEWHLPLVFDEDYEQAIMQRPEYLTWVQDRVVKLSVARCARVSYLTHEGKRDVAADLALYDRLLTSGHMSPFEHAALVIDKTTESAIGAGLASWSSNFSPPWRQHRKDLPNEAVFRGK